MIFEGHRSQAPPPLVRHLDDLRVTQRVGAYDKRRPLGRPT
jgi:hypothetical protein